MRVLVTGTSGHVGAAIASDLTRDGHQVVGLSRRPPATAAVDEYVQLDLAESGFFDRVTSQVPRCDAIVHAAAAISRSLDEVSVSRANCVGTQQIVRLARAWETRRLAYISGVSVIGLPRRWPITEDHPVDPPTAYLASKAYGETLLCLAVREGLTAVTLRLTSPVGTGMPANRILSVFVDRALAGEPLTLLGKGLREQNYVDVRDVAQAVRLCLKSRVQGIFHIAGDDSISNLGLARRCIDVLGSDSAIELAPGQDPEEGVRWQVSIEKARHDLAYRPRIPIEQSIQAVATDHAHRADQ